MMVQLTRIAVLTELLVVQNALRSPPPKHPRSLTSFGEGYVLTILAPNSHARDSAVAVDPNDYSAAAGLMTARPLTLTTVD